MPNTTRHHGGDQTQKRPYQNPFRTLRVSEWALWIFSLVAISAGFLFAGQKDLLTLSASLIGVTALIFVAKGDPLGQVLTVVFSVFYAVISLTFRYYGEMITYLGMTAPIAVLSTITWFKNPYKKGENEVKVTSLTPKKWAGLLFGAAGVTFAFYFVLRFFHTANLFISTVSVTTSFLAAGLTFLRSPYYGLGYGANDIVLIIMWAMASKTNPAYLPMVVCFAVFLANDCYGFFNWQKIQTKQATAQPDSTGL